MRPIFRVSLLTALSLVTSSGVVMASSGACRVAVVEQLRGARAAAHRRAHHSAATLARWKIGATAWSKAHGGKVYAGVPTRRQPDWTPLRFTCDDIVALDPSRPDQGILLPTETQPDIAEYAVRPLPTDTPEIAAASLRPASDALEQAASWAALRELPGAGAISTAGGGLNGPIGPASFPPAPVPPPLASPVPAPESPTILLLGTGMLSFLVSKLRRRTVV